MGYLSGKKALKSIMSHNFSSGVFLATPAWHRLGWVIRKPISSEEAIKLAGLDWQIIKQPICRVNENKVDKYVRFV